MTDRAALVEKVARAMCDISGYDPDEETINRHTGNYTKRWKTVAHQCSAAIDLIRAEVLEEAAVIVEFSPHSHTAGEMCLMRDKAAAIRALKGK